MNKENKTGRHYAITIDSDYKEIERVNDLITKIVDREGIGEDITSALRIALEEMICNSIMHGFNGAILKDAIHVSFDMTPETAKIRIVDHAPAFNPVEEPAPDLSVAFEEREPGGMGIHLARNLMDKFTYEYSGDSNIVTLEKSLTGHNN
jgi:anti-sigma regulatory factor (Ser/Thr protein kinase)